VDLVGELGEVVGDDDDAPLLEDLASRLTVLIGALVEPEFGPLRDLVAVLDGDGSLDDRWAAALTTLTAFGTGDTPPTDASPADASPANTSPTDASPADADPAATDPAPPARKAFWKR
ncbi:hypothetical protein ACWKSP_30630, partial [Micromonosporaceae bacterium Da 78-11]